jgi:hypothetical protein
MELNKFSKCFNCDDINQIKTDFFHHKKSNGEIICEKCCYHLFLKDFISPNYVAYDDFFDSGDGSFDFSIRKCNEIWNDNNKKIFFKVKTGCNAHIKFIVNKNYENYDNLLSSIINYHNFHKIYQDELKKFSNILQILNKKCSWLAYNFHSNLKNTDNLSFEYF